MIYIASDHAGVDLKQSIMDYLDSINENYVNLGTDSKESVDYPDYAHDLCSQLDPEDDFGILICGTGIGMSMTANKYPGVRCALAVTKEMITLSCQHNDPNVLALGARLTDVDTAIGIVDIFLTEPMEPSERHLRRISKIDFKEINDVENSPLSAWDRFVLFIKEISK